ncbi:MAG: thiamine diphosphokinase [Treponemataceae bacterium]|nr:thiamine diphosphokinase [Treponemataceae bacterium]
MNKKTCVIVSGGTFSKIPEAFERVIQDADFVIACDYGFENAEKLNLKTSLLIGDFDSMDFSSASKKASEKKISIKKLPCEKDDTDTMFAARICVEQGFEKVFILCAFGGRLDHSFANLQTMVFLKKNGIPVTAFGDGTVCTVLSNESRIFPKNGQSYFSVFSAGEPCKNVSISGSKYDVDAVSLTNDYPIGISNEWVSPEVSITAGEGFVFVMEN